MRLRIACIALLACAAACFAACKADDSSARYSVGGTVIGLEGSVTLANNGHDTVTVTNAGAFVFPTAVQSGAPFAVTVATQPYGQTCLVNDGSGTVSKASIGSVRVTCITTAVRYTIGGTVSGLPQGVGTLVLTNSVDQLSIDQSGVFTFPTAVPSGTPYDVQIKSTPPGYTCSIASGSGVTDIKNVVDVQVMCTNMPTYPLGGTLSGLPSDGNVSITLANGADQLTLSANGSFVVDQLAPGAPYHVTVGLTPGGWSCTIQSGDGNMTSAGVSNLAVACSEQLWTLSGSITGASGPWTLQDGNRLVNLDGNTTFAMGGYHYNQAYTLSANPPPVNQVCTIQGGQGIVTQNVNSISIVCGTAYKVTGTVSGQTGPFAVALKGNSITPVSANASSFAIDGVANGTVYSLTVAQQPTGQKCTISGGNGTVNGGDAAGASIACVQGYTVSGALTGNANGLVLRVHDGNDLLDRVQVGGSAFSVAVTAGNHYWIEAFASPRGQACAFDSGVTANQGSAIGSNLSGANITCGPATYFIFGNVTAKNPSDSVAVSDGIQNGQSTTTLSGNSYRFTGYADQSTLTVSYVGPTGEQCIMPGGSTLVFDEPTSPPGTSYATNHRRSPLRVSRHGSPRRLRYKRAGDPSARTGRPKFGQHGLRL